MTRTQIQLPRADLDRLRALSAQRKLSVAGLVREGVDRVLADAQVDERYRRLLEVEPDHEVRGETDVSVNHDKYLAEIWSRDLGLR